MLDKKKNENEVRVRRSKKSLIKQELAPLQRNSSSIESITKKNDKKHDVIKIILDEWEYQNELKPLPLNLYNKKT